jgi:V8-like Glu-specific endopeptidase
MKLALSASGITWIDPGNGKLQYTTKVASGSSGSPCFDANWNLVALHHAGSRSKGEGILMSSIFEQIRKYLN